MDGLRRPQSMVLLGGTSELGLAIARRYLAMGPLRVVLAGRPSRLLEEAAADLAAAGAQVEIVPFDAAEPATHEAALGACFAGGDVDLAVVAFGLLPDQDTALRDPALAVRTASVNYTGAVSAGVLLAREMTVQGHGVIVVLSSVAGERPRPANFLYGSAKAGLTAFTRGLAGHLGGTGVRVLLVRAGFVHTRMTAGLSVPPLATTPDAVAEAVVDAVWRGSGDVWVPRAARPVALLLRLLPHAVLRRLP
ncbi:decaprenylphospho-beta-D-erythro-pentofuranosid-2-ulose 2-reductase [Herbidospora sp. NEAU-GS84]|uniref:Decaprenylphospho-beta-D-erythro-pentofuranosid-2-ulose 2-reductase n=1 Tax=Herbidospora solisilvae TaxID=2696284 RepID=A0A7C9NMM1_9ACTN|nr:decaprenylphospho-beta-D-erythro-pentofuranosid-2-ulose 2-reductase [Herbidospora solisilvae]NAS27078.1 decaprenylphospho-beta-D-erythro-pentofuranosid-2-ulose 2-reductase [Herbidospora solisilvae]